MRLVAGIDLSTQSCTVELRDSERFVVRARARIPLARTTPPVSEQNAADWWDALIRAFRELSQQADLSEIGIIAVSGQCHGLVALDRNGVPVRPVKLWNDTTSAREAKALVSRLGRRSWAERTGSVPTAAFTISKLSWLIANEPQSIAQVAHIVLPHDYINYKLTGEYVTDRSEASGTGYFNSQTNVYDFDLLNDCFGPVLPWEHLFPHVGGPNEIAGFVTHAASAQLGIRRGIPVTVGGGDQHVAALGLGISDGDVVISLGTSGVVYTSSRQPITSGIVDGVANATGGWLPLICTLNATKVTDWAAKILGVSIAELDSLAFQAMQRNEALPVFAAYLDGERTPAYPGVTGVMAGLTTGVDRAGVALSAYYGVVLGLLRGLREIRESGVDIDGRYTVVGGGSRSRVYPQVCADLFQHPIELIDEPEATARGACVQALAYLREQPVAAMAEALRPHTQDVIQPCNRLDDRLWSSYLRVSEFAATTSSLRRLEDCLDG